MGYRFYGWKNADIRPVSGEYRDIESVQDLYDALRHVWCEYTCTPRLREDWSEENPTLGQCAITAFLAQDIFGGEVLGIPREGGNFHCYNKVGDCIFDLTSEQFGDEKLNYADNPLQSREVHFSREEKRQRYDFLKHSLKLYLEGHIPTGLPGGFFIYENSPSEDILFAEENVIRLYDCESLEDFRTFTDNSFKGMVHPDDYIKIQNQIQAQTMFGEKRHDYVRYRIITKNGDIRYIEDFGHLLHGEGGKSYFYVFIVDVDQNEYLNRNRNSYAEAEVLSMNQETDSLTGLFNMSFFYQSVQQRLSDPESMRLDHSIVHFDIPNFKLFNERNGFRLGDELLCDLAKTIRGHLEDGIAARFSDDHFVVFACLPREEVIRRVENIYRSLLLSEDSNKRVRIKAGIYCMEDKLTEIGLACDHARLACNSIKNRHDVFYCVYNEMLREKLRKQQYVVDHVDEAIEHEYIKVYYQPVIRVKTGKICGYEALVRWIDPKLGFMPPSDFIETLEQFHLIHKVDRFVVEKVLQDYNRSLEAGDPIVPASVNLSRLDFELCDIFGFIEETRARYNVPRNMLDLEITESTLNGNVSHLKEECTKMQDLGYQIWLDDFGSGYSSLNTLTEHHFDVLKLDMVFLKSFDHNPKTAALMNYIIDGARGLGLQPLCEGVETEDHFAFLQKIGCEKAQGYHFGKPMPYEEARAFALEKGMEWESFDPVS
ncbi:MAG: GGDEF and EAL domain-containing protein [Lachnospiraceae bacterium]|nr:GGDEF and EAL domain-containing protein [Lachnospiraceae bacterium]